MNYLRMRENMDDKKLRATPAARKLDFSDWRLSAAAVGIIRYLKYHKLNYSVE